MTGTTAEATLKEWRYGQTMAERLAAGILHIEQFESIDPQHPLGGPDGLKDLLCSKNGLRYVAAAYFPSTTPTYNDIKEKFTHDIKGVELNDVNAFVFFVNQHLTIGERQKLKKIAGNIYTEIYHLERICSLLNAPKGCGLRLEYLRIAMTEAEQWSFWHSMNSDIEHKLNENKIKNEAQFQEINHKLDALMVRTMAIHEDLRALPSSSLSYSIVVNETPTANLTIGIICWIHRIISEVSTSQKSEYGQFRTVQTWIGAAGSLPETAIFLPPPPEDVYQKMVEFINWWNEIHPQLINALRGEVIKNLALFHHKFLSIHPFLDGNGRVARCLIDQAAKELLNQGVCIDLFDTRAEYYEALNLANLGDMAALEQRIEESLN